MLSYQMVVLFNSLLSPPCEKLLLRNLSSATKIGSDGGGGSSDNDWGSQNLRSIKNDKI